MSAPTSTPQYQRFDLYRRIEHILLIASFSTLAFTGLPQKYVGAAWADGMIGVMGGIELVRVIHRFAATLLMLESIYHFAVMAYKVIVRRVPMTMLPSLTDALDAWQAFIFNLGLAKTRPQMGRFNFEEKAEYWALVWGTIVMIITGFMMWNPIATTRFFPGQFIPAAKAAHGGEAVLAVSAIILWHFYGVHLRHFNKSMWTGHLTEHEMLHEHPIELADLKAGLAAPVVPASLLKQRQQIFFPVTGFISLALLGGVYYFVSFEQTAITTLPPTPALVVFAPQTPTPLPPTATPKPVGALTWAGYVEPLLSEKCSLCHGNSGGLSLVTYADALLGGASGPAVVPGNPGGSKLIEVQSAGGHPGQLTAEELARIKEWIDKGAPE